MRYILRVTVDTDYANIDAPDYDAIKNEIQSNLEYEAHKAGITYVHIVRCCDLCGSATSDGSGQHRYCRDFQKHIDAGGTLD